jgi:predicted amidophosphoribosyltransferase
MKPDRSARADFTFYRGASRLIALTSKPRTSHAAIAGLLAALLCNGCTGPFRTSSSCGSCSEIVSDETSSEIAADCDCVPQPPCHVSVTARISHKCLHALYFPGRVCEGALNFCAHNEAVGPPDIQGPGRFHPVPTHPVFAPVPEPVTFPDQP